MLIRALLLLILLVFASPLVAKTPAQNDPKPPLLYFILDASGSMWGELPDKSRKIAVARSVLRDFLAGDFQGQSLAFRIYGHRQKGDCRDSELVFPPGQAQAAKTRVVPLFDRINPKGKTPIIYSLQQAAKDLKGREAEIILITDGLETCDGDPCDLIKQWQKQHLSLKIHVVGLGLTETEHAALACLATTSGGSFHAASSAKKLADSLSGIHQSTQISRWTIAGEDEHGASVPVEGWLRQAGSKDMKVSSRRWFRPAPGTYQLEIGVPTENGTLFQPVTHEVTVEENGDTRFTATVATPPTLRAVFLQHGNKTYGSLITAYQDGKKAFSFRPKDQVYVEPGTYEFRAQPNQDNKLKLTQTIGPGDALVLSFELKHTVKVHLRMVAQGSGMQFRENYELWQDGSMRYRVHMNNGARVLPGTYAVHLPSKVSPYVHQSLVIDETAVQEHQIEVPCGHVDFAYTNSTGQPVKDKRVFLYNLDSKGSKTLRSGQTYPLVPGRYKVLGWPKKHYEPIIFEVQLEQSQTLTLKQKAP